VDAGRIIQPGGPRVGDPWSNWKSDTFLRSLQNIKETLLESLVYLTLYPSYGLYIHSKPHMSYMFTVSLIRVICSLYPWYELYVHCIPIRIICPLYPWYELYVNCIPYMSCYVPCTASAFASSLVTRKFNIPKSQHYPEPEVSACHLQNVIFLQPAWKRMW